jgi:tRNA-2-methylthio-N6-dimethylallyladenosine synthase
VLSKDETYGDISPVRLATNGINALVSITRGCDNMCTFCVVPFTRGRERSRDPQSILEEVNDLASKGYKEIMLLGQNVDSYLWYGGGLKKDFKNASEIEKATATSFSNLLALVAEEQPKMRIRFSTSNPQDMTEDVLHTVAKYPNICNYIHLPFQSGNTRILKEMNRQHTREEYMALIDKINEIIPNCGISQDIITGFPTETEEEHQETISLLEYVKFHFGFMFKYSERPGTMAARKLEDDIPEEVKKRRLTEIVDAQRTHSAYRTNQFIGQTVEVLIERESKKSDQHWSGRNEQSLVVVFPKENYKSGDFVMVKINDCTSATLKGIPVGLSDNN